MKNNIWKMIALVATVATIAPRAGGQNQTWACNADATLTKASETVFREYSKNHDAALYAEDATFTDMTNMAQPLKGPKAIDMILGTFYRTGFSNASASEDNIIVCGNRVMLEFTFKGKHTGDFFGIPATNKDIELHAMSMYEVKDGKIQWARLYYDSASIPRQMGLIK